MTSITENNQPLIWKESANLWIGGVISLLLLVFIYNEGLKYMVEFWDTREEYGHGYIIPLITLFLIWQRKDQLEKVEFNATWSGFVIVGIALIIFYVGELSSIYTVIQYSFLIALFGVLFSVMGARAFRIILVPFLILLFMIPLPNFFLNNLSSQLQLISSQIGVAFIRLFDISVYLEGNVIDLGNFKLQVVEACSGLNYLFPLMTLGFISAYFFKGAIWKKAIIFLSTIPVTVLMNSFRIGAIGVMVEYWGQEMAEGFLHDFEGWAVFMSCIAILIAEMWILANVGSDKLPLREAFGLDFPADSPKDAQIKYREIPKQLYGSIGLLLIVGMSVFALPERVDIEPERKNFSEFPLQLDGWDGRRSYIEQIYIDALKLTDYAMNDYVNDAGEAINFYSAYYSSQKKGASAHSPRSCIPGGGWRITNLETHEVKNQYLNNSVITVNRLVIQKGEIKQLVYYWFDQRGRIITNEYLVKWYIFWDSLTKNRTDGALIRLTTVIDKNDSIEEADKRLSDFMFKMNRVIPEYVPD